MAPDCTNGSFVASCEGLNLLGCLVPRQDSQLGGRQHKTVALGRWMYKSKQSIYKPTQVDIKAKQKIAKILPVNANTCNSKNVHCSGMILFTCTVQIVSFVKIQQCVVSTAYGWSELSYEIGKDSVFASWPIKLSGMFDCSRLDLQFTVLLDWPHAYPNAGVIYMNKKNVV